jgi:uncharacterized protein (DUF302 family)
MRKPPAGKGKLPNRGPGRAFPSSNQDRLTTVPEDTPMLYTVDSEKTVQEIEREVAAVCGKYRFGVLGYYDLQQKLKDKGLTFEKECLVFEVCNPQHAKKVLDDNIAISTALPCRIAVYQEDGKTRLATIKPTALLALFPTPELKGVAEEVEASLIQIMKELAEKK